VERHSIVCCELQSALHFLKVWLGVPSVPLSSLQSAASVRLGHIANRSDISFFASPPIPQNGTLSLSRLFFLNKDFSDDQPLSRLSTAAASSVAPVVRLAAQLVDSRRALPPSPPLPTCSETGSGLRHSPPTHSGRPPPPSHSRPVHRGDGWGGAGTSGVQGSSL
jgi:hypothetical protein